MKTSLLIQVNIHGQNKWRDAFTMGNTIDEIREEIVLLKFHSPKNKYRIIQREIVTTDQVIEDHPL